MTGYGAHAGESDGSPFRLEVRLGDFGFGASGEHDLVLAAYERAREDLASGLLEAPHGQSGDAPFQDRDDDRESPGAEFLPLPVYMKRRDLETNALKAAAIVAWAQRYESRESLTPSDVEAYWRKTPYRLPANVARDLGTAATQGWVRQEGHGEYSATGYGSTELDGRIVEEKA